MDVERAAVAGPVEATNLQRLPKREDDRDEVKGEQLLAAAGAVANH